MPWGTKKKSKASIAAAKRAREAAKAAEAEATAKRLAEGDELAIYGDPEQDRGSMYADYWSTSSGWDHAGFAFGHYASLNSPAAVAFVKQAAEWVGRVETGAEPVPLRFAAYTYSFGYGTQDPTFGFAGLSDAQLAWYFTWRDAVRRGAFPPVDDAYVVLLATEIVNGIGVLDPAQGFRALTALDAAYGQTYGLKTQFGDLLEDYALLHGLDADLDSAMRERGWREVGPYFSNRAIQARTLGDLSAMPYRMIAELSGIDLDVASDFLLDNDLAMAHFVPRGLAAIDAHVRRAGKGGVVERLTPKTPKPVERIALVKVNYVGKREKVLAPRPPYYSAGDRIAVLMKGVMRHTENRLRAAAKAKGRTSAYVLTDEHKAVIDATVRDGLPAFAAEFGGQDGALGFPAPPKVEIDPERVSKLQDESDAVRGMLIEAMGSERAGDTPVAVMAPVSSRAAEAVERDDAGLSGSERAVLRLMLNGGDVAGDIRLIADRMGTLAEVMVDGINEAATDRFGEPVIDVSGPAPAIYEEYREDVAAWVGR